ncbi:hypothetical protein ADK42_16095 [Streptomyces rimosus subsp. rimosus]|nr:hypothetical protein ADK42_16095 [Streptomyces rimosus subsp. rimosus]
MAAAFPVPDWAKSPIRSAFRSHHVGSSTPSTSFLTVLRRSLICSMMCPVLWGYGAQAAKLLLIFCAALANASALAPCQDWRTLVTASSNCFLIPLLQSSPTSETRTFFQPLATSATVSGLAFCTICFSALSRCWVN